MCQLWAGPLMLCPAGWSAGRRRQHAIEAGRRRADADGWQRRRRRRHLHRKRGLEMVTRSRSPDVAVRTAGRRRRRMRSSLSSSWCCSRRCSRRRRHSRRHCRRSTQTDRLPGRRGGRGRRSLPQSAGHSCRLAMRRLRLRSAGAAADQAADLSTCLPTAVMRRSGTGRRCGCWGWRHCSGFGGQRLLWRCLSRS